MTCIWPSEPAVAEPRYGTRILRPASVIALLGPTDRLVYLRRGSHRSTTLRADSLALLVFGHLIAARESATNGCANERREADT